MNQAQCVLFELGMEYISFKGKYANTRKNAHHRKKGPGRRAITGGKKGGSNESV